MDNSKKITASFRDPAGFVFLKHGVLYRQVNNFYARDYNLLMQSGLYEELAKKNLLIAHKEVNEAGFSPDAYKIIQPEFIPFISYPYEWSFSELKDAALLTLRVQKIALRFGMSLKDASSYNIQFKDGRPILIDTLSFEKYRENAPWAAYRQFCQHFLAPLALMSLKEITLNQLLRIHIDGIPLDLASTLLPKRSWFKPALFFHIHMHAKGQRYFSDKEVRLESKKFSRVSLSELIESLRIGISSLYWEPKGTEWGDYFGNTNYSETAIEEKRDIVSKFVSLIQPKLVWDVGANDGFFSRLSSSKNIPTIAFDIDPAAVEKNYLAIKSKKEKNLLPLILDLTNPSPSLGWNNKESASLIERGPADLALALALIHHLAISNNVPFSMVADFFSKICKALIIEFIPKDDSQVQRLLRNRYDLFGSYSKENFKEAFENFFSIKEFYQIPGSKRVIYLMKKRGQ